jgi:acyl-CoA synthetase (NDP forming)
MPEYGNASGNSAEADPEHILRSGKSTAVACRGAGGGFMGESDAKEVLSAYGLPVIRTETAKSEEDASRVGRDMGIRWS